MKNTKNFLVELETKDLKLSQTKNGIIVNTTQRNEIRKKFLKALENDLKELAKDLENDIFIGFTTDGLAVAVGNEKLSRKLENNLTFKIDIKVSNLDYDIFTEIESYEKDQEKKAEKRAKALEKKKRNQALNE